jgi:gamma-polyglutamate synthase
MWNPVGLICPTGPERERTGDVILMVLLALGSLLAYLAVEQVRVRRHRRAIPLLIAVTGTRGKTSVTRMLAAVLRADGRRVLAKTTGSEAVLVLPDGSETPIRRRGHPSIIEQKHLLSAAARARVDVVVAEVMSLHPENHRVETERLLRPDLLLITNARLDHVAAMGSTRDDVARVLALDILPGSPAFIPAAEWLPPFRERADLVGSRLLAVSGGEAADRGGFGENLDLVRAVARWLDVQERAIQDGVRNTRHDRGALRVWRWRPAGAAADRFLVNAFAANDPASTLLVLDRVLAALDAGADRCIGLLSLRGDRGDRSAQWLDALDGGILDRFGALHVAGPHGRALQWRLGRRHPDAPVSVLSDRRPAAVTDRLVHESPPGAIIFGFGNMGGLGEALVDFWRDQGEEVDV